MNNQAISTRSKSLLAAVRNLNFFLWFAIIVNCEPLIACPNCKSALADAGRALGYAVGILMMMSAPFALAGFWAFVIIRLRRKMQFESPT